MNCVHSDRGVVNAFRRQVWRFGVRFPHQGARECARRLRQRKPA